MRQKEGKVKEGRGTNLCRKRGVWGQYYTRNGLSILAFRGAVGIQLAEVQELGEASWSALIGALFKARAVLQPIAWSSCVCVRWEGSCCNPVAAEACRG